MRERERGSALTFAVIVLGMTLLVMAVVVVDAGNKGYTRTVAAGRGVQADYLAQAGLEKALFELTIDEGYEGEGPIGLDAGVYKVVVEPVEGEPTLRDLEAVGRVPAGGGPGEQTRYIRARVRVEPGEGDGTFRVEQLWFHIP